MLKIGVFYQKSHQLFKINEFESGDYAVKFAKGYMKERFATTSLKPLERALKSCPVCLLDILTLSQGHEIEPSLRSQTSKSLK